MKRIQECRIVRICLLVMAFVVAAGMVSITNDEVYAAAKPAQTKNVKLSSSTATSLKVSWSKAKNAKKYQVAYKKVGATTSYKKTTTTSRTKTISKLSNDTTYYVKVRAVNGKKYGKWSTEKKFKTKANYNNASNESKVKVTVSADTVTIKISSLGLGKTGTLISTNANTYISADANDGIVSKNISGTKIGTFKMNKPFSIDFPRYDENGYDRLYDKYYVVYDGAIIKGPVYATSISAKYTGAVEKSVPSKKGIIDEVSDDCFDIAEDLGSNWTAINIDLTQLILASPNSYTETIDVNGKTYYMNKAYVDLLDSRLSRYEDMGINVVGVVISFVSTEATNNYPRELKYIDDARWTNGFNTSTEAGRDYYIAGMEFLANRYSQGGNGLICNYVIGNEVDYAYDWFEVQPNKSKSGKKLPARGEKGMRKGEIEVRTAFDTYMEEYARALRLANLAVKKYNSDVSVGISLSKEWAKSKGEQKKSKTSSKWYDTYSPKKMLDWLNYYAKKGGDYDWSITPHNYPMKDGNTAAYETAYSTKTVYITGNVDKTPMITQNNLEVMQLYLNKSRLKYAGKVRELYFTENGASSHSANRAPKLEEEKAQAAAVAQYYFRAASLPSTKAIIYYKTKDRAQEGATSFKLGLIDLNGDKKLAYDVWKYIDTDQSIIYKKGVKDTYLNKITFKKGGKKYNTSNGRIKTYRDVMAIVSSNFNWKNYWNISKMTPVKVPDPANTVAPTEKVVPETSTDISTEQAPVTETQPAVEDSAVTEETTELAGTETIE